MPYPWLLPAVACLAGAIDSPADLWRGFDPEALPLDVQVRRAWREDGCDLEKLTFAGEVADGFTVRVFGYRGAPAAGAKLPGVLHIHGGGQTALLAWVKFWAARGYVCVTFDFCGPWEQRTEYTDWGPLARANMRQASAGYPVGPDPRSASWYHWAVASRRALTLLARHPRVDPGRLGVFGISVGGTLTWVVAGADPRVKAAVPIYGCGYNVDRRRTGVLTPDAALYQRVLSPEAHAPYVRCPLLFLDATNDFHGVMDNAYESLAAARGPVRQAFTPRYNHHIDDVQAPDLGLWMDSHLRGGTPWPASPRLALGVTAAGTPRARVRPDDAARVRSVDVYYALGLRIPQARFWRRADAVRRGDAWEAKLPVMDTWDGLAAFANVTYASGVCLSTNLERCLPGQLGKARATLAWSDRIGRPGAEDWVYVGADTDPVAPRTFLRECPGPGSEAGFQLNPAIFGDPLRFTVGSHVVGDPQFQGRDGRVLAFDCKGGFPAGGLQVVLTEQDWTPHSKTYTAAVRREDLGPRWHTVRLPRSAFVAADGRRLARWEDAEKIELKGATARAEPPCFARFRWLPERGRN